MPLPQLEFLFDASKRSLQDAELAELNRSSNFAKAIRVEIDAWIESAANAKLYRLAIETREELIAEAARRAAITQPKKVSKLFTEGKSETA